MFRTGRTGKERKELPGARYRKLDGPRFLRRLRLQKSCSRRIHLITKSLEQERVCWNKKEGGGGSTSCPVTVGLTLRPCLASFRFLPQSSPLRLFSTGGPGHTTTLSTSPYRKDLRAVVRDFEFGLYKHPNVTGNRSTIRGRYRIKRGDFTVIRYRETPIRLTIT